MPIETAVKTFHQPYNCAEAVFKAFDPNNQTGHAFDLGRCGGGRAPDGQCGALFGAKLLVPEEQHDEIESKFVEKHGSTKCRELKRVHRVKCVNCVETSAELTASFRS